MNKAIAINGTIPAYFTEGDIPAEVYVHNHMKMETSIHCHGIILPSRYDGVPYLIRRIPRITRRVSSLVFSIPLPMLFVADARIDWKASLSLDWAEKIFR